MGLPAGHVTAVPGVSRNDQLKMLGNGVVPRQAEAALRVLLGGAPSASSSTEAKGHEPSNAQNRADQGRQLQLGHAVGLIGGAA